MLAVALIIAPISCSSEPSTGATLRPDEQTHSKRYGRDQALMGTRFQIQVIASGPIAAAEAIDAAFRELARVELLISEWRDDSEISAVNHAAGGAPVAVGHELFEVVTAALEISALTQGAFDITFASCGHLWSFKDARRPSPSELRACLPLIDYRLVELHDRPARIALASPKTRIGVGGIGKGYAVDRAAATLEAHGITSYVVDGGGDIRLRGQNLGRPWRVGIAHPRRRGQLLGLLEVESGAVVSSGDYERFFEEHGTVYHHILDPTTGTPAREVIAVTVIAPTAMWADALSTALFVMGPERGLALVERLARTEALIIAPDATQHTSSGFPSLAATPTQAR